MIECLLGGFWLLAFALLLIGIWWYHKDTVEVEYRHPRGFLELVDKDKLYAAANLVVISSPVSESELIEWIENIAEWGKLGVKPDVIERYIDFVQMNRELYLTYEAWLARKDLGSPLPLEKED